MPSLFDVCRRLVVPHVVLFILSGSICARFMVDTRWGDCSTFVWLGFLIFVVPNLYIEHLSGPSCAHFLF